MEEEGRNAYGNRSREERRDSVIEEDAEIEKERRIEVIGRVQ